MAHFNLRSLHRWLSLPFFLFLGVVSATGIWLQIEQFDKEAVRESTIRQVTDLHTLAASNNLSSLFAHANEAATDKGALQSVELSARNGHPVLMFSFLAGVTPDSDAEERPITTVTMDAVSGKVLSEETKDRESFILKLHTGEVFGEPGVVMGLLWGLALFILVATGIYMYGKMYLKRRSLGRKGVFWMLPLIAAVAIAQPHDALAGSPFQTDDPGFAASGWEIKPSVAYEQNVNGEIITGPVLDLNYTIIPTFKINLTLAGKTAHPDFGLNETGLADTDFKFKWRFLEEDPDSWVPALSIAPNVTIPTASRSKGLGDGSWRTRLPLQIGKTFGDTFLFGEAGYQWAFKNGVSDNWLGGIGVVQTISPKWQIGIELNGSKPVSPGSDYQAIANVGVIYNVSSTLSLQASLGRTIRDDDKGGPEVLAQFFVQMNFP